MPLALGEVLNNRYQIISLLGQGGFGAVYKALDLNLNVFCAVKENYKLLPTEQDQFAKEARLLFKLKHTSLPSVHDLFTLHGKGQFLVMDFIEGVNLTEIIEAKGKVPEVEATAYITQVCDALTYLHSQNPRVIHRDIKPNNIKVTPQGKVFLVDFGIAKTGLTGQPTSEAARGVTPGYSPPEQYGRAKTDPRTDIYALGATLYALLTGQEPPASTDRVVGTPLLPPRQLNATIPPALEAIILKAMEIAPDRRYPSAEAFKTALHTYKSIQPVPALPKKQLPHWVWLAGGLFLSICVVLVLVITVVVYPRLLPSNPTITMVVDSIVFRPTATSLLETDEIITSTYQPDILPTDTFAPPTLSDTPLPSFTPTSTPEIPFYNLQSCSGDYFDGQQCTTSQGVLHGPLTRVYGSWELRGLHDGMVITREWYLNNTYYWTTTNTVGQNERWSVNQSSYWIYIDCQEGSAAAAFGYPTYLPAGEYRMDMYLDGQYITALIFTIINP